MNAVPAPMTPPECDLQDFPFMPLHVARLRDSDLAAEASPEACWYAVLLWAASWHQLPAASLPDNEAILTKLLGLGRDVKTFRKHRDAAMRGFVLCSDGRLYHPVVAEQAVNAWNGKLQQRWRTECARIKKQNQRNDTNLPTPTFEEFIAGETGSVPDPGPRSVPEDTASCPQGQRLQEIVKGIGRPKKEAIASSVGSPSPMPTALELFDEGPSTDEAKPDPWDGDADFTAAWKACTDKGRTRSSRAKAWPEWRKAVKRVSGPALATAVTRYVAQDEDAKRTGGPGFHLWLKDSKFEHWLAASGAGSAVTPICTFSGPAALRKAVVDEIDESFAVKFIDPAGWREADRTLVVRNAYADVEVRRELRQWLIRMKVCVEVAGQTGADRAA